MITIKMYQKCSTTFLSFIDSLSTKKYTVPLALTKLSQHTYEGMLPPNPNISIYPTTMVNFHKRKYFTCIFYIFNIILTIYTLISKMCSKFHAYYFASFLPKTKFVLAVFDTTLQNIWLLLLPNFVFGLAYKLFILVHH